MIKKINKPELTFTQKLILFLIAFFSLLSALDYFFDRYTLQFPLEIKLKPVIIKRNRLGTDKNPRSRLGTPLREETSRGDKKESGGQTSKKIVKNARNSASKSFYEVNPSPMYPKSKTSNLPSNFNSKSLKQFTTLRNPLEAIYVYFGSDVKAYAIAMAESGLNCKRISKTKDYGLFQINKVHLWRFKKQGLDPFNCWDNAKVAYQIQKEQGWYPWSVYKNKSYLKHLNRAKKLVESLLEEKEI